MFLFFHVYLHEALLHCGPKQRGQLIITWYFWNMRLNKCFFFSSWVDYTRCCHSRNRKPTLITYLLLPLLFKKFFKCLPVVVCMHRCAWHAAYVCGVHICMCVVYMSVCICCMFMSLGAYVYGCVYVLCGSMFVMSLCSCAWVHMCVQMHVQTEAADAILIASCLPVYCTGFLPWTQRSLV